MELTLSGMLPPTFLKLLAHDIRYPSAVQGTEEERYHAFEQLGLQLTTRIRLLLTILEREKGKLS